jgi:hypothetical protein
LLPGDGSDAVGSVLGKAAIRRGFVRQLAEWRASAGDRRGLYLPPQPGAVRLNNGTLKVGLSLLCPPAEESFSALPTSRQAGHAMSTCAEACRNRVWV